jgi:glycosyltransferase involved in cell wall biosynthesis
LNECLESLTKQTADAADYEVIVVNNNSTDHTEKVADTFARNYSNFRVVKENNQGLSYSRNRGWQEAKGEYVAYIDDDAKAAPDWCEKIISAFQSADPRPVAVGGKYHPWYESEKPDWFKDEYEMRTWGDEAGFLQLPNARYGFSGSNMAFRKEILHKYNGFSTDFGMIGNRLRLGEDAELFSRIYENDPSFWYDPAIMVFHWVPSKKMRARYILQRCFAAGESMIAMHGVASGIATLKLFVYTLIKIIVIPFVVLMRPRHWQRPFLKHAMPAASNLGSLKATIVRSFDKNK